MSPNSRDHQVELFAPKISESRSQIFAVNDEPEHAFVHVKHNWKISKINSES